MAARKSLSGRADAVGEVDDFLVDEQILETDRHLAAGRGE
jgi:hypothetical protein